MAKSSPINSAHFIEKQLLFRRVSSRDPFKTWNLKIRWIKMKSFELIRKYMRVFGISKRNPNHQIVSIFLNCIHFGLFTIYLLGNGWFLIFEAQTFAEYSECSFYLLCAALVLWWYLVYVVKRDEYSELMDDLDAIIGMSKLPFFEVCHSKF